jgi:hypothetical protein
MEYLLCPHSGLAVDWVNPPNPFAFEEEIQTTQRTRTETSITGEHWRVGFETQRTLLGAALNCQRQAALS